MHGFNGVLEWTRSHSSSNSRKFDFGKVRNNALDNASGSKLIQRCNAYSARRRLLQGLQEEHGTTHTIETQMGMPLHRNTMIYLNLRKSSPLEAFIQNRMVLRESSWRRKVWNVCLFICLSYTGIVLPYRLAFVENRVPEAGEESDVNFFEWIEFALDLFFCLDFFVCFFITYRDERDREVLDIRKIVRRYLQTYFVINLFALMPPKLASAVFNPSSNSASTAYHKVLRFLRLQRMSRLARMIKLARMVRIARIFEALLPLENVQSLRGIRIVNLVGCLLWVAHLAACFWFLAAAFHCNPTESTWLSRRMVAPLPGTPLYEKPPFEEWLHSMYFVMTVFTTVGFGDIYAETSGEIIVVTFLMMVGTVANGIVLSEVINVITCEDQKYKQIKERKDLICDFAEHTALSGDDTRALCEWIELGKAQESGDTKRLRDLLTDQWMPREIMESVAKNLYDGALLGNKFISMSSMGSSSHGIQSCFAIMVGLAGNHRSFDAMEVVYHSGDRDSNIFLVLSGVFTAVATPLPNGGYEESHTLGGTRSELQQQNVTPHTFYCEGSYFGDMEPFSSRNGGRLTTIRCESFDGGDVLILQQSDWQSLLNDELVHSIKAWKLASYRKDNRRIVKEETYNLSGNFMDVACSIIQRYWRKRKTEKIGVRHNKRGNRIDKADTYAEAVAEVKDQCVPEAFGIMQKDVDCVLGDVHNLRTEASNLSDKLSLIVKALSQNAVNLKDCNWSIVL